MRRLLAVILLFSFFCQAFATARQGMALDHDGVFDAKHAQMHLEGAAHHHGEDGLMHEDDSQASIQHMLAEAGVGAAALLELPPLSMQPERPLAPAVTVESAGPPPCLAGLRRPPRLLS
jgi:hypothetical protein